MRLKTFMQASACVVVLSFSAVPAPAQELVPRTPGLNSSKMDDSIKSYQDALKYYQTGQLKLAEKELEKFLGKVGQHAGGNFLMGMIRIQQNDFEKARTSFRVAVKLDPALVSPHGWLGAVESALGNPQAALAQKAELEKMKAACVEPCAKAADIALEIRRIDETMAAQTQKPN